MKIIAGILFFIFVVGFALVGASDALADNGTGSSVNSASSFQGGAGIAVTVGVDLTNTVRISNHDKYYHRDNCPLLGKNELITTRDYALSQGYEPCPECNP